ncbi:DUF6254 family protein [Paenibacillus filicis]|uniref:DUF6254 family protein n=1 Tax=Paenibacillus filicis TaxID=669464 RepID=A0ABU9DFF2_9BACL
MSHSKRRQENEWKIRKQSPHPHGKIKAIAEYSDEYDAQHPDK